MASSPVGTLYRGREGMWSWVLHRITGVTLFFFLFAHVVDIAMVRVSPEVFNRVVDTYKNPVVGLMEAGLVGGVPVPRAQRHPDRAGGLLGARARATSGR